MTRWGTGIIVIAATVWAGRVQGQRQTQPHIGIDRVGSYLSYTWVDHARRGWDLGAELDMGSVFSPAVHMVFGLNYLTADINRTDPVGTPLKGGFHDVSATADLRLTVARYGPLEPFVGAGIGAHFLGNDITGDASIEESYTGTKIGAQFFGGIALDLTADRRWSAYAELRRIEVSPVGRTTIRLGAFVRL